MNATDQVTFDVTGLDGVDKTYHLRPILRKEANWVFHTFLQSAMRALSEVLSSLENAADMRSLMKAEIGESFSGFGRVAEAIDFDKLWAVANLLFRGGEVTSKTTDPIHEGSCTVTFGDKGMGDSGEDYFRDHPDELYVATLMAVNKNWPGVFTAARARIGALFARLGSKKSEEPSA